MKYFYGFTEPGINEICRMNNTFIDEWLEPTGQAAVDTCYTICLCACIYNLIPISLKGNDASL